MYNFISITGDNIDYLKGNTNFTVFGSNPRDTFLRFLELVFSNLVGFNTELDNLGLFKPTADNILNNLDYLEEFFVNTNKESNEYLMLRVSKINKDLVDYDSSLFVDCDSPSFSIFCPNQDLLGYDNTVYVFMILISILGILRNGLRMGVDLDIDEKRLNIDMSFLSSNINSFRG